MEAQHQESKTKNTHTVKAKTHRIPIVKLANRRRRHGQCRRIARNPDRQNQRRGIGGTGRGRKKLKKAQDERRAAAAATAAVVVGDVEP
ncbi:hypothetical protein DM860_012034 [Cuscuta australis]|uniref:Uncharacterized protein n=1 Tax=Cuscuta australis TaxID=267555 RepID=A0A328DDD2_9ASTE|nr:hypothetical protein DM860_012034 [Cuscuta australis]